jgi:hypothetical protein
VVGDRVTSGLAQLEREVRVDVGVARELKVVLSASVRGLVSVWLCPVKTSWFATGGVSRLSMSW